MDNRKLIMDNVYYYTQLTIHFPLKREIGDVATITDSSILPVFYRVSTEHLQPMGYSVLGIRFH